LESDAIYLCTIIRFLQIFFVWNTMNYENYLYVYVIECTCVLGTNSVTTKM
jgi:hypothetical protein